MIKGVYIYVWQPQYCSGGDMDKIIADAKTYGYGLIFKSDDGGRWYPNPVLKNGVLVDTPVSTLIARCEAAGVPAAAWGYHYGAPAPQSYYGYQVQTYYEEYVRACETINIGKPRFYALNNEVEYEGRAVYAEWVASQLRLYAGTDYDLVSACLPVMRYHPASPYYQWSQHGFRQAPELYWSMFRGTSALWVPSNGLAARTVFEGPGIRWEIPVIEAEMSITGPSAPEAHLLDGPTLAQYWKTDSAQYGIDSTNLCPTYMDAPAAGAAFGVSDDEITQFLAQYDPKTITSMWVWDLQHMNTAAKQRAQRVAQWLSYNADDKRNQLLADAKAGYDAGNKAFGAILDSLNTVSYDAGKTAFEQALEVK